MSIPRIGTETGTEQFTDWHLEGNYPLHPLSCFVTEERNGEFELEMDIENTDRYFKEIKIGRIITAPHDSTKEEEYFEVYSITNSLTGVAHVSAWHISYRTQGILIAPFTVANPIASYVATYINQNRIVGGVDWMTLYSDIEVSSSKPFIVDEVKTMREVIKMFLDEFGGELEYWQYIIRAYANRGKDSGITLRYGQNITAMTREQTNEDLFVGVYPFWQSKQDSTRVTLPEKVIVKTYLSDYYDFHKPVIPLDLSDYFDTQPTTAQLRSFANDWLLLNAPRLIPENIDVSVLQMNSEGRSSVAKLNLCDTVRIYYPGMGINVTAKVTKVVYNVLLDRYESISIGTTKNMNTAIKKVVGIK